MASSGHFHLSNEKHESHFSNLIFQIRDRIPSVHYQMENSVDINIEPGRLTSLHPKAPQLAWSLVRRQTRHDQPWEPAELPGIAPARLAASRPIWLGKLS